MTYSAWLATTARKELLLRDGLEAVAEFERAHGAFSAEETAAAAAWTAEAIRGSADGAGPASRRSA